MRLAALATLLALTSQLASGFQPAATPALTAMGRGAPGGVCARREPCSVATTRRQARSLF